MSSLLDFPMGTASVGQVDIMNIRKLGRHWYDQTVMTRANLVDTV